MYLRNKKTVYNKIEYLYKNDIINKFNLLNIYELPCIKKINIQFFNKSKKNNKDNNIKFFLLMYIYFLMKPYIVFNILKTIKKGKVLKLFEKSGNVSFLEFSQFNKDKILEVLYNLYLGGISSLKREEDIVNNDLLCRFSLSNKIFLGLDNIFDDLFNEEIFEDDSNIKMNVLISYNSKRYKNYNLIKNFPFF